MKEIKWNEEKNRWLKKVRNVCFEDFVDAIINDKYMGKTDNKNYPGQKVMFLELHGYIYMIPYIPGEDIAFLKTIIPSRKATKKYLKRKEK